MGRFFNILNTVLSGTLFENCQKVKTTKKQTDIERRNLNGKVKTLDFWHIKHGDNIDTTKYRKGVRMFFNFNKSGYLIESKRYAQNPYYDRITKSEYIDSEILVKSKNYSNKGELLHEYNYEYDNRNNLIKSFTKGSKYSTFHSYSLYSNKIIQ